MSPEAAVFLPASFFSAGALDAGALAAGFFSAALGGILLKIGVWIRIRKLMRLEVKDLTCIECRNVWWMVERRWMEGERRKKEEVQVADAEGLYSCTQSEAG